MISRATSIGKTPTIKRQSREFDADVEFILDANQGFDEKGARALIRALSALAPRIRLIEQPVAREDLDAMASLCGDGKIPIAADEFPNSPNTVSPKLASAPARWSIPHAQARAAGSALRLATQSANRPVLRLARSMFISRTRWTSRRR